MYGPWPKSNPLESSLQRSPHLLIPLCRPYAWVLYATGLIKSTAHIKWQTVLANKHLAKHGVHVLEGMGPAVRAELGDADVFIGQIVLTGKCFRNLFPSNLACA
jgi:hypothetical protein